MSEPSLALQDAVLAALSADAAVAALVKDRIYDEVPVDVPFPYVEIGDDHVVAQPADCFERAVEVYSTIHVWSRAIGRVETKQIAGAIADLLDNASLTLAGFTLLSILHKGVRYLADPDGKTTHGVISFCSLIDPA